jgi:uncharacterized protein
MVFYEAIRLHGEKGSIMNKEKAKKLMVRAGYLLGGSFLIYSAYRVGCQRGVDVTHDAIENICDEETFNKVDETLKNAFKK